MGLPKAMMNSGWLLSITVFCLICFTYWIIYNSLIYAIEGSANHNYAAVVKFYYGIWPARGVLVAICIHCVLLMSIHFIRIMELFKFVTAWIGIFSKEDFTLWVDTLVIMIISIPLFIFGSYIRLHTLKYIPIFIFFAWVYLILLALKDILFGNVRETDPPAIEMNNSTDILWTAIESFNAIQCVPIIYQETQDSVLIRKSITKGLIISFLLFSVSGILGSNFHKGSITDLSLVHFSINNANLKREIDYFMVIGIIGIIAALVFSILLLISPARLSVNQLVKGVYFSYNKLEHHLITYSILIVSMVLPLIFSFDLTDFQFVRKVSKLLFCLCYPFLIYMMVDKSLVKKIAFGIWIGFLFFACIYGMGW